MTAPVSNSIALAQKYLPILDEIYKDGAKSSILDTAEYNVRWIGAKTIQLFNSATVGLGNYSRNAGFEVGDATQGWETYTLNVDRGRSFSIDTMDNDETIGMAFGSVMGEFERVHVVPEVDAYRFAKYAQLVKSGAKTAVNVIQRRTGAAIRPVERKAEYVDLNLPSRNLWTTCNLGANSEEQAGNYYAWAEKTPKNDYTWKNYSISLTNLPMYIDAFYTCDMEGFMLEGIAEAPYDPSCKKMFIDNGAKTYMRTMPTKEDFQELIDYCTIEEKTVLGIKGLRFTGPNGNTIFMPYAGSCYDGKKPQDGTLSCYWISDRMNCPARKANALKVQGGQATFTQCQLRTGLPIRPLYALVSELIIEPANSGLVDGINDVQQTEKTDDTIYNLQGIKMQGELKPGIYVRNGRKFVVN